MTNKIVQNQGSYSTDDEQQSDSGFYSDNSNDADFLFETLTISKLQPRNIVIKVCWKDELSMAEVLHHKGRLLMSIGIIRNGKIYLSIEETLFLAEIGALTLVDEEDIVIPLKDIYKKIAEGQGGCSWEYFEVYRYLKSLGYIVGRHGVPWSLKNIRSYKMPLEGSAEDKEAPNVLDCTSIVQMFKDLHITEMKPFLDVYLPNTKFKKTSPGDPNFAVWLARHHPPSRTVIENLHQLCDVPVKIVHLEHGRVSFFSFNEVELPSLP